VEPFAGSASLFFEMAPKESILGDLNSCVIDVYRAIQMDAEGVAATLDGIPKTPEAYYQLRSLDTMKLSLVQRAARLIFLMKACFNGVYRTNKLGKFNVPMGDKIYALPSRDELFKAQSLLRGARLLNADFAETVNHCRPNDWIYMDPPYRSHGRFRGEYGYNAEFCSVRVASLVTAIKRLSDSGCYVTLSYSFDEELIDALSGWYVTSVTARRSVAGELSKRVLAREIIVQNYKSTNNDAAN
jgi:DNA adenine methylase